MKQALEMYIKNLNMTDDFMLQASNNVAWGDYSCNIAFTLPGEPINNAKKIIKLLKGCSLIEKAWVSEPGFICIQCYNTCHYLIIKEILDRKENFFPDILITQPFNLPDVVNVYKRLGLVLRQLNTFREDVREWQGLELPVEKELLEMLEEFIFLKEAIHLNKYLLVLSHKVNRYFDVITLLCENLSCRQVRLAFLEAIFWVFHNGLKLLQLDFKKIIR